MSKPGRRIKIIAISLMVLSFSSCISRLSRPEITGFIVDYDKKPVKNLPEGMIRRLIGVEFKSEKSAIQIQEIRQYESTFDGPNKETDTLSAIGSWELINNKTIKLNVNSMNLISGSFKLSEIDLYQLKLTK